MLELWENVYMNDDNCLGKLSLTFSKDTVTLSTSKTMLTQSGWEICLSENLLTNGKYFGFAHSKALDRGFLKQDVLFENIYLFIRNCHFQPENEIEWVLGNRQELVELMIERFPNGHVTSFYWCVVVHFTVLLRLFWNKTCFFRKDRCGGIKVSM